MTWRRQVEKEIEKIGLEMKNGNSRRKWYTVVYEIARDMN